MTIYRNDYQVPVYLIKTIDLTFELGEQQTVVTSQMTVYRNPASDQFADELKLDGDEIVPEMILLNGKKLTVDDYSFDNAQLTIVGVPKSFEIEIKTIIKPQENSKLMGLYKSSGNFCTQCEAEGFRKITFFPDRPDILSTYTVTIIADQKKYPILLSNGNLVDSGIIKPSLHWVKWHDPFPKPGYLFALVAGDLAKISDLYKTISGREVKLEVYSEAHNIEQCHYALESLKKSMLWDEQVYGREYDLDVYMIVAVDDFNMGAMENKGLNIFNSKYVLAHCDTATDSDFLGVESVIAHEYFHNWSGNRVTCRDWFQLSLKEGFTVFRDQEFSSDMHSRGVKRVEDINLLRTYQFREDAGPMSHPVRPESYQEINNFYTLTVYNKGAEVVRMLSTIVGRQGFRSASDLYFKRHDGQAATIEDFVKAMEDANNIDLNQFRRWYSQPGTPKLEVNESYDSQCKQYSLSITQSCSDISYQNANKPFHIPIVIGLLDHQGSDCPLSSLSHGVTIHTKQTSAVLHLTENHQDFVFDQILDKPMCSLLRGFSAPVITEFEQDESTLSFLMANDSDVFNRWEASQRLMKKVLLSLITDAQASRPFILKGKLSGAVKHILENNINDPALSALLLTPPSELYLAEQVEIIDPVAIHHAREFVIGQLANLFKDQWLALYDSLCVEGKCHANHSNVGRRRLRQVCLDYLISIDDEQIWRLVYSQYQQAGNMTDRLGAFKTLLQSSSPEIEFVAKDFFTRYKQHALVMDKWLAVQAAVAKPQTLGRIKQLEKESVFDRKNPNRLRSLVGTFVNQNPLSFHASDGSGYDYLTGWIIELDPANPQIAARLVSSFNNWERYDTGRQKMMKKSLNRISNTENLSPDVREIVSKALNV